MPEIVIDTNVLYVAEGKHDAATDACVLACINRLEMAKKSDCVVVDDGFRIIGEYLHKLDPKRDRGVGAAFLKWLLQNLKNEERVAQVALTERAKHEYAEFPVANLESKFDPPDRMFPAVANARATKPRILQAVDCKWLRWWPQLCAAGVTVDFLCPVDVCRFHQKKFPTEPVPPLP